MKTRKSQCVIINCQEIFVSNTRYLQNVFVKYQTNIRHKSHPFEFQGCVTVYSIMYLATTQFSYIHRIYIMYIYHVYVLYMYIII